MKKLKIALLIIAGVLALVSVVCYIFWKDQTTYIFECIIDFINRPLPIVGVSTGVILYFVYKCFISTKYGKKRINEFKEENDNLRHEIAEYKQIVDLQLNNYENGVNSLKNDIQETKEYVIKGFELNKNIKVKEIAKKMRGAEDEETVDSDTKEE